ncbi:MAG: PhzF family phenazine biosynthesis protein [Oscillospiraceae bacterium]|jgi:PhzF family phenazine biosynthesis protein|nr:PhzF family phenazine biosynthesis protein [Oscillospiraceae bacterium]
MDYYVIDAFSDALFGGNPAGVCLLDEWLAEETMQNIAAENNLAETAFVVKRESHYDLRWFTPETEIDLCGHATLASAFVVTRYLDRGAGYMEFHTKSGVLPVRKNGDLFEMDFPSRNPEKIGVTALMEQAVGAPVLEAHMSRDMLLLLKDEEQVRNLKPDLNLVAKLPGCFALIVTAQGGGVDFVSRFFAPGAGIPEDPVTGSSHATLIPFWAKRLQKEKMTAKQLSRRGGTLYCEDCGGRVKIAGRAALYLRGEIFVNR